MDNLILFCIGFTVISIVMILILRQKNETVANIFHSLGKSESIVVAGLIIGCVLLVVCVAFFVSEYRKAAFALLLTAALILSVMQVADGSGIDEI